MPVRHRDTCGKMIGSDLRNARLGSDLRNVKLGSDLRDARPGNDLMKVGAGTDLAGAEVGRGLRRTRVEAGSSLRVEGGHEVRISLVAKLRIGAEDGRWPRSQGHQWFAVVLGCTEVTEGGVLRGQAGRSWGSWMLRC